MSYGGPSGSPQNPHDPHPRRAHELIPPLNLDDLSELTTGADSLNAPVGFAHRRFNAFANRFVPVRVPSWRIQRRGK